MQGGLPARVLGVSPKLKFKSPPLLPKERGIKGGEVSKQSPDVPPSCLASGQKEGQEEGNSLKDEDGDNGGYV